MATVAYSSLLGLALPTQGDLTGQWGDEVNDYITKYLDASVAGGLSITADVTLTKTTGTALGATSSQYAILTCSPASVNIVVTAPAAYKIYVVNNTSASYTVTIRGAGPTTGVVLSALEKAVVAWNGTDFFKVATSATDGVSTFSAGSTGLTPSSATSGVVTLAGTLAVANGGTGVTTSTGTTNVVLSNSPTLVTPALGVATATSLQGIIGNVTPAAGTFTTLTTSSTVTINGGTANGVAYLDGSKVLTTGSALTFDGTNLGVGLTATSPIEVGLGSAKYVTLRETSSNIDIGIQARSSIASGNSFLGGFATNSATGETRLSAGDYFTYFMTFYRGGSEQMRLTSTGLGIGTNSPTVKLDVVGAISATGTLSGGTSGTAYSFSGSAPATSLTLDSSGNLGVNTTSMGRKLNIAAPTAAGIQLQSTGTGARNFSVFATDSNASVQSSFAIFDDTASAYRMIIDSAGNLGLGVTPSAWGYAGNLQFVNGGAIGSINKFSHFVANAYFNSDWKYASTATSAARYTQNDGAHEWHNAASGTAGNTISFTQAMTLDANGRLGVGTTSPSSYGGFISVDIRGSNGGQLIVANSAATNIGELLTDGNGFNVTARTNNAILFKTNDTERMRLDSSGNLGIGTSSPTTNLEIRATNPTAVFSNSATRYGYIQWENSGGSLRVGTDGAFPIRFDTNATERARIDSSGNLLVGKTSSGTTNVGVESRADGTFIATKSGSTSATETMVVYSTGASALRFYVSMDGTVNATSIVITAISDERLKENVRDINTGLDAIMALKPRRFDWREGKGQDKKDVAGFIAQEFETVFPECVNTSKAGADGIEYKNINHETLIPTLVKAIQEQQALITQLTARITALETA